MLNVYESCTALPAVTTLSLFGYLFLTLSVGSYLAYKTRKIPSFFNESLYISACVYQLWFLSLFLFPLDYLNRNNPTAQYATRTFGLFIGTAGCLFVVYLPKVIAIHYRQTEVNTAT